MICTNCGKEIADDSKFCNECGYNINPDSKYGDYVFDDNYVRKHSVFSYIGFWLSFFAIGLYRMGWFQLFLLAVPALVFSIIGVNNKKHPKKLFGIIGIVLSIIAIIICFWEPPFMDIILPDPSE